MQLADESGLADSPSYLDVILRRIDEAFPLERTLVFDVGRHVVTALKRLHTSETRGYIHTLAFGSIGLGMGCAIGAAVGRRDTPVLFTVGDGGFMNGGLMEFNSAVRHDLDVVVLVLNDGAYGAEHIQFRALGLDPSLSTFRWPDFAPIAESLGGLGLTVRSLGDLDGALAAISRRDRPVLVDIKLDPDEVPPDR